MNLQRIGRKNMILMGYSLCITATICFGLCDHIPKDCNPEVLKPDEYGPCPKGPLDLNYSNSKLFFGLSLLVRFIQGMGDSMVATSAYSIVSIEFPESREVYIGYCQTAVGLGLLLGPVIGTSIFNFAGYEGTFYVLAGILGASLTLAFFLLPGRINKYKNDKPNEMILDQNTAARPSVQGMRPQGIAERHSVDMVALAKVSERYSRRSHIMQAQVTFKIFLTNLRAMTAIVSAMFAMIFMLFYEPIFVPYIHSQFGYSEGTIGYFLAIGCFTYAFGSPLVGLLCSKVQRKYITCFAFIICSVSLFLTGPSVLLHFPGKDGAGLAICLTGIGALGFSVAFLFVPLLPEIIASVAEK
jgi:MFS family permease